MFSSIMPATFPEARLRRLDEAKLRRSHAWEAEAKFGYNNWTRLFTPMKARNNGVIVNIIGVAAERFNYDYITGVPAMRP